MMVNTVLATPIALVIIFVSSIGIGNADNTPNLCTDDIPNLVKVKPSETNLVIDVIPNITVGSATYDGDAEHFVISKGNELVETVLVYLPGTTDRPELSSCLLKSVSSAVPFPTIGLSYNYLSSGDSFRNGKCKLLNSAYGLGEQVNCLEQQHKDAIDGGEYGYTHYKDDGSPFWGPVDPRNSITARLGKLLQYLDESNPGAGWDNMYTMDSTYSYLIEDDTAVGENNNTTSGADDIPQPNWSRIVVMGHSQGAGHAAYLGQTKDIQGAVMISGPQDECIDCPDDTMFWIDNAYTNDKYTAFASGDEPLYALMEENWKRMKSANATDWGPSIDVDFALATEVADACKAPLVSRVKFADTSTCGGKAHCSTAIDDSVPFIEKTDGEKGYLYEVSVWPSIAMVTMCTNTVEPEPEMAPDMSTY